jgi:hypothetical protein
VRPSREEGRDLNWLAGTGRARQGRVLTLHHIHHELLRIPAYIKEFQPALQLDPAARLAFQPGIGTEDELPEIRVRGDAYAVRVRLDQMESEGKIRLDITYTQ